MMTHAVMNNLIAHISYNSTDRNIGWVNIEKWSLCYYLKDVIYSLYTAKIPPGNLHLFTED